MYRKILIPLDGSPLAELVLPHVQQVAVPGESELLLVHALHLTYVGADAYVASQLIESVRDQATRYVAGVAQNLQKAGYDVQVQVWSGHPPTVIEQIASDEHVDLIAMSTHGRTGIQRWALGSVADAVVRHATCPVLLVRAQDEAPVETFIRRVLVPLDGSPLAEAILPHAKQIARQANAGLLLIRVVPPLPVSQWDELFDNKEMMEKILEDHLAHAEEYLARLARELRPDGTAVEHAAILGEPAEAILQVAVVEEANFIAMATHGRGGLARLAYGSVASRVLNTSHCPLLLVRGSKTVEADATVNAPVGEPVRQVVGELSPAA